MPYSLHTGIQYCIHTVVPTELQSIEPLANGRQLWAPVWRFTSTHVHYSIGLQCLDVHTVLIHTNCYNIPNTERGKLHQPFHKTMILYHSVEYGHLSHIPSCIERSCPTLVLAETRTSIALHATQTRHSNSFRQPDLISSISDVHCNTPSSYVEKLTLCKPHQWEQNTQNNTTR